MNPIATTLPEMDEEERRLLQQAALVFRRPISVVKREQSGFAIVADVRTGLVTFELGPR
jgi:hypothetical protein